MLLMAMLAAAPCLSVQVASLDLTPPERLPLGGYTERRGALYETGGDPLMVRALILSGPDLSMAIVSVEMLTIPESLYREVRARIPKGLTLFMTATHTHCAPDSQMLNDRMTFAIPGIASYRERWLDWYADRIAQCVSEAEASPPAAYAYLVLKSFRLHMNKPRRVGARPETEAYELNAPGNRILLTEYAAHPTIYGSKERHLRGDWIGSLARRTGAIGLLGAIGDVSPDAPGETSGEQVANFVRQFDARSRPTKPRNLLPVPFISIEQPIALGTPVPHPDFAKRNGLPEPLAVNLNERFAPPSATLIAFRLGKLAVLGIPGEPSSEIGRRLTLFGLGLGFQSVWVISHVNGWIGYILTPEDYRRGGYEATLSFYGPSTGDKVIRAGEDALRRLKAEGLRKPEQKVR